MPSRLGSGVARSEATLGIHVELACDIADLERVPGVSHVERVRRTRRVTDDFLNRYAHHFLGRGGRHAAPPRER